MTSSSYYKADSAKDIQEIIETEANITPIRGHPDCHTLIQLLNQLCKGAKEVSCDYSAYGLMWLCLPQPIYYALTRENVVAPMQPPQTPPYNPEGTATENALITIQWQKNKELWDQMQNANKALINAAKGALNEESRDALTNLFVGTADRNFFLFFDGLYTKGEKQPQLISRRTTTICTNLGILPSKTSLRYYVKSAQPTYSLPSSITRKAKRTWSPQEKT